MDEKIDVATMLGAVTRAVRSEERDGAPARVVVATRVYETDLEDAWHAITTAERIARWLMPIEGELRLGGRYQLQGNAGGTITTCEPPRHLAATWEYGGEVSWVDARLESLAPARTRLTVEHAAVLDEARWGEFGPGAVGVGWELMLLGLYLHLASGGSATPEEGMAWAQSADGLEFQRRSSEGWGEASIAAGTEPSAAQAAAARTTAFYTGAA